MCGMCGGGGGVWGVGRAHGRIGERGDSNSDVRGGRFAGARSTPDGRGSSVGFTLVMPMPESVMVRVLLLLSHATWMKRSFSDSRSSGLVRPW